MFEKQKGYCSSVIFYMTVLLFLISIIYQSSLKKLFVFYGEIAYYYSEKHHKIKRGFICRKKAIIY